ncbi:hypothetical protein TanjilG_22064 [Lupinus angustifolius]|uniref:KIB1-4 beta-propeller domain-containing protein n=1 Tax=Lupinus angustifolius TaxID=3871 RepID=A0A4P1QTT0_LUPAN|nr:PREDICTED: F-box protein SKIP23-like [Lupinus angustifolius]OIV94867.1 hypothetical protein TanjilG_22064 [Lupinus angustifolius]
MSQVMMFDLWEELPSDLLPEIAKHLHSSKDYVRFRATCKTCYLNLSNIPNHITGPKLMIPFDFGMGRVENFVHLRLPEKPNRTLYRGSGFGWLIGIGIDGVIRMLDPVTNDHIDLPPMSTTPDIVEFHPDNEDEEYTITGHVRNKPSYTYVIEKDHIQKMHLHKIIMSSSPKNHNHDFMALAIYGEQRQLALCRIGDSKWTTFSTKQSYFLQDVIFYEGKIYGIDIVAKLFEFDPKTLTGSIVQVPPPKDDDPRIRFLDVTTKYLIRNVEGDLLLVVRRWEWKKWRENGGVDEKYYNTTKFNVYKLDKSVKQWKRVSSVGNSVLVVGFNTSICMLPFSDGKNNWVRNCIYFSDNHVEAQYRQVYGGHDVGIFNLQNNTIQQFFPDRVFLCPPPLWLLS